MLAAMAFEKKPPIRAEVTDDELQRLKYEYLPMWADACYGSRVGTGLSGEVPYADYMKGSMREFDETGGRRIDHEAVNKIDQAIDEITPKAPLALPALSMRYMNARGPSVFRHGRLLRVEKGVIEDVADLAERLLVPVLKRKGIPL